MALSRSGAVDLAADHLSLNTSCQKQEQSPSIRRCQHLWTRDKLRQLIFGPVAPTGKHLVTKRKLIKAFLHQKLLPLSLKSMRPNKTKLPDSSFDPRPLDLTSKTSTSIQVQEKMGPKAADLEGPKISDETQEPSRITIGASWTISDDDSTGRLCIDEESVSEESLSKESVSKESASKESASKESVDTLSLQVTVDTPAATAIDARRSRREEAKIRNQAAKRRYLQWMRTMEVDHGQKSMLSCTSQNVPEEHPLPAHERPSSAMDDTTLQEITKDARTNAKKSVSKKDRSGEIEKRPKRKYSIHLDDSSEIISVEQAVEILSCTDECSYTLNIHPDCPSNVEVDDHEQLSATVGSTSSKEKMGPLPKATSTPDARPLGPPEATSTSSHLPGAHATSAQQSLQQTKSSLLPQPARACSPQQKEVQMYPTPPSSCGLQDVPATVSGTMSEAPKEDSPTCSRQQDVPLTPKPQGAPSMHTFGQVHGDVGHPAIVDGVGTSSTSGMLVTPPDQQQNTMLSDEERLSQPATNATPVPVTVASLIDAVVNEKFQLPTQTQMAGGNSDFGAAIVNLQPGNMESNSPVLDNVGSFLLARHSRQSPVQQLQQLQQPPVQQLQQPPVQQLQQSQQPPVQQLQQPHVQQLQQPHVQQLQQPHAQQLQQPHVQQFQQPPVQQLQQPPVQQLQQPPVQQLQQPHVQQLQQPHVQQLQQPHVQQLQQPHVQQLQQPHVQQLQQPSVQKFQQPPVQQLQQPHVQQLQQPSVQKFQQPPVQQLQQPHVQQFQQPPVQQLQQPPVQQLQQPHVQQLQQPHVQQLQQPPVHQLQQPHVQKLQHPHGKQFQQPHVQQLQQPHVQQLQQPPAPVHQFQQPPLLQVRVQPTHPSAMQQFHLHDTSSSPCQQMQPRQTMQRQQPSSGQHRTLGYSPANRPMSPQELFQRQPNAMAAKYTASSATSQMSQPAAWRPAANAAARPSSSQQPTMPYPQNAQMAVRHMGQGNKQHAHSSSGQHAQHMSTVPFSSGSSNSHLMQMPQSSLANPGSCAMDGCQHMGAGVHIVPRYEGNFPQQVASSVPQQMSIQEGNVVNNQLYPANYGATKRAAPTANQSVLKHLKTNNPVGIVMGTVAPNPGQGQLPASGQYHARGYRSTSHPVNQQGPQTSQEGQVRHMYRPQPGPWSNGTMANATNCMYCGGNPCSNPLFCNIQTPQSHPASYGPMPHFAHQAPNNSTSGGMQNLEDHVQSNTRHLQDGQNSNPAVDGRPAKQSSAFMNQFSSFPQSQVNVSTMSSVHGPAVPSHSYAQPAMLQGQVSQVSQCKTSVQDKTNQGMSQEEIVRRNQRDFLNRRALDIQQWNAARELQRRNEVACQRKMQESCLRDSEGMQESCLRDSEGMSVSNSQAVPEPGNQPSSYLEIVNSPRPYTPGGRFDAEREINFVRVGDSPGANETVGEPDKLEGLETPEFLGLACGEILKEEIVNYRELPFEEKWKQARKLGHYLRTQLPLMLKFAEKELKVGNATVGDSSTELFDSILYASDSFTDCSRALYDQHYCLKTESEEYKSN